jgi:hypothetical protein
MCVHCIVPQWDRGYILHRKFDKDPAVVTMYDRDGKKVLEVRLEPPDAAKVSLSAAAAIHAGGILAVGGGIMTDGSIQGFIAKTDLTGRTIQWLRTGQFSPHQVCEASDGTVWTLGYARDYRDSPDAVTTSCATIVSRRARSIVFFAAAKTVFQFSSALLPSTSKWMPRMEKSRAGMSPFLQSLAEEQLDLQ